MAPLERLKILMQIQGNQKQYTGVVQVGAAGRGWPQLHPRGCCPCPRMHTCMHPTVHRCLLQIPARALEPERGACMLDRAPSSPPNSWLLLARRWVLNACNACLHRLLRRALSRCSATMASAACSRATASTASASSPTRVSGAEGSSSPKQRQRLRQQRQRLRQQRQPKAAAAAEAAPAADVVASALEQQQQLHVQQPADPRRQFAPRTGKPPHPADSPRLCSPALPGAAIKFLTYEQLSRKISHYLIDQGGDGQLTPVMRLLAGAGAQRCVLVCGRVAQAGWRASGRVVECKCRHPRHERLATHPMNTPWCVCRIAKRAAQLCCCVPCAVPQVRASSA